MTKTQFERDIDNTMPRADTTFQQSLEDELIMRLQQKQMKEQKMTVLPIPQHKLSRLPLTLAVAILATILIGGVIIAMSQLPQLENTLPYAQMQNDSQTGEGLSQIPDEKFQTVYIAAQDIPMGTIINEFMVYETQWRIEDVERVSNQLVTDINALVGKKANTYISRFEPIKRTQFDEIMSCSPMRDEAMCEQDSQALIIPQGMVAVALPILGTDMPATALQAGQQVDVIVGLNFVDVDEEFQSDSADTVGDATSTFELAEPDDTDVQLVLQRTVTGATVLQVGGFAPDDDTQSNVIMLAVRPQDATVLTFLAESQAPMMFTPTIIRSGGMSAEEVRVQNALREARATMGDETVTKLLPIMDDLGINVDELSTGESVVIRFTFSDEQDLEIPAVFERVVEGNVPDYSTLPATRKTVELLQFSTSIEWANWFDYIKQIGATYEISIVDN